MQQDVAHVENRGRGQRRDVGGVEEENDKEDCGPAKELLAGHRGSPAAINGRTNRNAGRVLYCSRYSRCAASSGKCCETGYGYALIAWNGSGSTDWENA